MKKALILSALVATPLIATTQANAYFGENFSQTDYDKLKTIIQQNPSYDHFREAFKTYRQERRAERKARWSTMTEEEKAEIRENRSEKRNGKNRGNRAQDVTRSVEKITNGIMKTITSDNSETVERLHNKTFRDPRNESVQRTVEKLDNGLRITLTSDNAEVVEKIQNRAEKKKGKRSSRQNRSFWGRF